MTTQHVLEKEVILMRDSIDNSYASKYGYASDGTRWVLLSYAKVEMQRVEQQRDELQAKCDALASLLREAYGYTTVATDLLPERIKRALDDIDKAMGQQ